MTETVEASEDELKGATGRVLSHGFFPGSPAAVVRQAIFSDILAAVLNADPNTDDLDDLRDSFSRHRVVKKASDEVADEVWETVLKTYTTTGRRGARGKKAKRYILPFHPEIAKNLGPPESRQWGPWYQMLMTSGQPPTFNEELHDRFVDRLEGLSPSNIFEKLVIEAATELGHEEKTSQSRSPLRPYIERSATNLQKDLGVWLDNDRDSPSNWLLAAQDLVCMHFMLYFTQLAVNLRLEFEDVTEGPPYAFEPEIRPIHFGLWNEKASSDRSFSGEWRGRGPRGIEGDLYDSWGRLAVLRIIETRLEEEGVSSLPKTLSETLRDVDDDLQEQCVEDLLEMLPQSARGEVNDSLADASLALAERIRRYYETKSRANQTPISMGVNVVQMLGEGQDRQFWRTQRGVGPTFRLNRSALRFLARLFCLQSDTRRFDRFATFLSERGITLDTRSQSEALRQLEEMGLIDRQSDSGDAVYVRA